MITEYPLSLKAVKELYGTQFIMQVIDVQPHATYNHDVLEVSINGNYTLLNLPTNSTWNNIPFTPDVNMSVRIFAPSLNSNPQLQFVEYVSELPIIAPRISNINDFIINHKDIPLTDGLYTCEAILIKPDTGHKPYLLIESAPIFFIIRPPEHLIVPEGINEYVPFTLTLKVSKPSISITILHKSTVYLTSQTLLDTFTSLHPDVIIQYHSNDARTNITRSEQPTEELLTIGSLVFLKPTFDCTLLTIVGNTIVGYVTDHTGEPTPLVWKLNGICESHSAYWLFPHKPIPQWVDAIPACGLLISNIQSNAISIAYPNSEFEYSDYEPATIEAITPLIYTGV